MNIPLHLFEQYIDETILKRGFSYFNNGHVAELEEVSPGYYEAIIEGSSQYLVHLKVKSNTIVEHDCNCPYDYGPVCKHKVAAIFSLQQEELGMEPKKKKATKPRKKRKTKAEKIEELLNIISEDEMKQFIRDVSLQERKMRDQFLVNFAHHIQKESKSLYASQVKSILRAGKGRYGFIEYHRVGIVGREVNQMIRIAEQKLENDQHESTIYMATAIMEEMTKALQFADDSNGDIGGNINFALDLLFKISADIPSEKIRNQLFKYCIEAWKKKVFDDWDWQFSMLEIAGKLVKNDAEYNLVNNLIDNGAFSEYEIETVEEIKYNLIKTVKGERDANIFLEENLNNSRLREIAIKKQFEEGNYEVVERLSNEGINLYKEDKPGLVMDYYNWLLKIAQATHDQNKIIEYAHFLFIDNFSFEQDYYEILKEQIAPEKWLEYVLGLIAEIKKKNSYWSTGYMIRDIYIREQWWDKLLELLSDDPDLRTLSDAEKYLKDDYSDKLIDLYASAVTDYLFHNVSRKHYKIACKYLRRMNNLGGEKKVDELIIKLRKDYPARRALMEELDRV